MKKIKKICFDLDGVICSNTYGEYEKAEPYTDSIRKINQLYDSGYYIFIYTSRYMGRFDGDVEKVYSHGFDFTLNQLKSWKVKFHQLIMGKPDYDIIIDDKSIDYSLQWKTKL